jgi:hypothetical protein
MAILSSGQKLKVDHYNELHDRVKTILGDTGNIQRGFGQILASSRLTSGTKVTASQWELLRQDLYRAYNHQVGGEFPTGSVSAFTSGTRITKGVLNLFNDATGVLEENANNHSFTSGNFTTSVLSPITRTADWGGAGAPAITCTAKFTFADAAHARYFFNSGGKLFLELNHNVNGSQSKQSLDWSQTLRRVGMLAFNAVTTTRPSGSTGIVQPIGYYGLTTVEQEILQAPNSGGAYSYYGAYAYNVNDISVTAKLVDAFNVLFRITLVDEHANPFSDVVTGITSANFTVATPAPPFIIGVNTPSLVPTPWV